MNPRLYDISWPVDEPTYRADEALSYSTLAKFAREGFNKLDSLFDKLETPSLTFGSAVDALITGGQEEFDKSFIVAHFDLPTDSVLKMVNVLFDDFGSTYRTISEIPNEEIISRTEIYKYQLNWKPETRARVLKEDGTEYYSLKYVASGKTIIHVSLKEQIDAAVEALKTSEATKFYFAPNNVFNDRYVREYQLKFKATFPAKHPVTGETVEIPFRCMADLLLVDHEKKIVHPIDLKTSSHTEWDFFDSFVQWRYDIQARLYWRIIRYNMDKDPVFKDYELDDYTFIVVNKWTLTPLKWKFRETTKTGTIYFGKNKQIEMEDPFEIGSLLHYYLSSRPQVPLGVNETEENELDKWLNTI